MTRLVVSDQVGLAFPGLLVTAVVTAGFDGHSPWLELDEPLAALEARAAAGPVPGADDDPHIAAWHAAYRAFGTNPRRQRPSAEALLRRLARSGRLPRINPAVDCYNLVSASYGVPAGAFDLSRVAGDIVIRLADGSEAFTPLGEPGTTENPGKSSTPTPQVSSPGTGTTATRSAPRSQRPASTSSSCSRRWTALRSERDWTTQPAASPACWPAAPGLWPCTGSRPPGSPRLTCRQRRPAGPAASGRGGQSAREQAVEEAIRSSARRMLTIRMPTGLYLPAAGVSRYGHNGLLGGVSGFGT
jgi:B3/4 domain